MEVDIKYLEMNSEIPQRSDVHQGVAVLQTLHDVNMSDAEWGGGEVCLF